MSAHRVPRSSLLVALSVIASTALAADCTQTSRGFVPLIDLGTGTYQGAEGGLYSGGSNVRPTAHEAAGLARAAAIRPLNGAGLPDPAGRIVLLSIGMSNTTQEFSRFKQIADVDAEKNPLLTIVDGAQGGQDAVAISNPAAAFWTNIDTRLANAGVTAAQVQAVWLKEAIAGPDRFAPFPNETVRLQNLLVTIVQILHDRYPNLQIAYLSSRTYAGYATTTLNPEPLSYESGFAVKWNVRDQIAGSPSLNYDPGAGTVEAPWLSWGPYLWTDGTAGRSDGFVWECADTQADGTHPSASGQQKVADLLLAFMKSDTTATPWFLASGTPLAFPMESEPNDTRQTADPIADGFTIRGSISPASDVDHFAMRGRAGEEITIRVLTPGSSLNPSFTLGDGVSTLLSDSDDDDGNDAFGCVTLAGDALLDLVVQGEAGTTGAYEVSVRKGATTGTEVEPNATPALANFLEDDDVLAATIDPPGDTDLYGFNATPGTGFEIAVRSCGGPSPVGRDLQMRILDGTGQVFFQDNDSGPDADPFISGVLPQTETGYFVQVRSPVGGAGDPDFRYEIELRLANVTLDVTPITRGPVYRAGERLEFAVTARNRTTSTQSGLTFVVDAQPVGGGSIVRLRERMASVPAGFARTQTLSINPPPSLPRRTLLRLTFSLAQSGGPSVTRNVEVLLRP